MGLTLVKEKTATASTSALPPELGQVLSSLRVLLPQAGDLLPDDDAILLHLWPRDCVSDPKQVPILVRRLLALGYLRKVIVGREAHLCLAQDPALPQASAETAIQTESHEQSAPQIDAKQERDHAEQRLFQLQMISDVETERVLLYRVAIVIELLALLTLLRQLLLYYLAL